MLLPRPEESELAIGPPGAGPGYWAGASSAVVGDDGIYLAYRLRHNDHPEFGGLELEIAGIEPVTSCA